MKWLLTLLTGQEWLLALANLLFWQAVDMRLMTIYWASVTLIFVLKLIFKF